MKLAHHEKLLHYLVGFGISISVVLAVQTLIIAILFCLVWFSYSNGSDHMLWFLENIFIPFFYPSLLVWKMFAQLDSTVISALPNELARNVGIGTAAMAFFSTTVFYTLPLYAMFLVGRVIKKYVR
ncbi:MAG: hypothetical protein AAB839_00670 [Patescibacteria group bacterium]